MSSISLGTRERERYLTKVISGGGERGRSVGENGREDLDVSFDSTYSKHGPQPQEYMSAGRKRISKTSREKCHTARRVALVVFSILAVISIAAAITTGILFPAIPLIYCSLGAAALASTVTAIYLAVSKPSSPKTFELDVEEESPSSAPSSSRGLPVPSDEVVVVEPKAAEPAAPARIAFKLGEETTTEFFKNRFSSDLDPKLVELRALLVSNQEKGALYEVFEPFIDEVDLLKFNYIIKCEFDNMFFRRYIKNFNYRLKIIENSFGNQTVLSSLVKQISESYEIIYQELIANCKESQAYKYYQADSSFVRLKEILEEIKKREQIYKDKMAPESREERSKEDIDIPRSEFSRMSEDFLGKVERAHAGLVLDSLQRSELTKEVNSYRDQLEALLPDVRLY